LKISIENIAKTEGTITLPLSKSICNRSLIIKALYGNTKDLEISDARDSIVLKTSLENYQKESIIDIGLAGTSMRFLTAFLALKTEKPIVLKGNERMNERPIGILVEALNSIGANILYLEKSGFPPIKIFPSKLIGGKINIESNISSQFISALMMIAPYLENGLKINFNQKPVSLPYILMTKKLMEIAGAKIEMKENSIIIFPIKYAQNFEFISEGDWSAASYFFSIAAFLDNSKIHFTNLKNPSLQGDFKIVELFEKHFGVSFHQKNNTHFIEKNSNHIPSNNIVEIDFTEIPDMAQTFVFLLAAKEMKAKLTGLSTLVNKETNRVMAICNELKKVNVLFETDGENYISIVGFEKFENNKITFETYNDHRMAMALIPLLLKYNKTYLDEGKVVEKSFPDFWKELKNIGINTKSYM
jgi:3-phosphoshikimate 1-carboxyvinyltransferase